jgi:hypothetical protein
MAIRSTPLKMSAAGTTATVFGVLSGLGGITHGVGEVLQGDAPLDGLALDSWTSGPIATNMGGEPGISVFPNALAAGLATLAFSIAVVAWSAGGARRRHGGQVLVVLSTGMLLSGGGIGPPLLGILAGVAGLGVAGRRVKRLPARTRRLLARSWTPLFAVAAANAVFLVVGSIVLVYTVDLNAPGVFVGCFLLSILSLLGLIVTGAAYDEGLSEPEAPRHAAASLTGEA